MGDRPLFGAVLAIGVLAAPAALGQITVNAVSLTGSAVADSETDDFDLDDFTGGVVADANSAVGLAESYSATVSAGVSFIDGGANGGEFVVLLDAEASAQGVPVNGGGASADASAALSIDFSLGDPHRLLLTEPLSDPPPAGLISPRLIELAGNTLLDLSAPITVGPGDYRILADISASADLAGGDALTRSVVEASLDFTAVPEPTSLATLLLAVGAGFGGRRKR